MPINYGSTRVNDVFYGNKRVLQIYHGSNLVYNASVGLPEGYVGLEYIEATNGQYIDTGISFNNISKAKVEAKMVSYGGSGYPTILGCAILSPTAYGILIGVGPNGFYEQTGSGGNGYIYHSYPFDLNKHTFTTDLINKTMTIDDTMDTFEHDKSSIDINVYLLRRNIDGNTLGSACMCRCYSCKLWNNNNKLIANMIPAMKTSDGTVGMYDLKRRKFYSSGMADNFIAGPLQEHKLPKEYEELDYITNTSTAYIDTGIYLSGDNWDFDVEYDSLDNSISGRCIFGYQNGNTLIVPFNNSLYLQTTSTTPTTRVQSDVWSAGHHRLKINTNGGNVTYKLDNVASTSYVNYTTTAFDTDLFSVKPIYLFAYWYTSAVCVSNRYFLGRIHFFKMSQNGVLKCNLIPAKRISDGKIGMYDTISGEFKPSASNVDFEAGTSAVPEGYTAKDYIESKDYYSFMDTGIVPNQHYSMELDFEPTEAQSKIFAGTRYTNAVNKAFTINSGSASTKYFGAFDGSDNVVIGDFSLGRHKTYISRDKFNFDGTDVDVTTNTFQADTSIYLFGCNDQNRLSLGAKVKIYGCKIWNKHLLVANFVPCVNNKTHEEGFINTVNGEFITWGIDIPTEMYERIEYISSNSTGQYINTGVNASTVTRFVIKGTCAIDGNTNTQLLGGTNNGAATFFGARILQSSVNWYCTDSSDNGIGNNDNISLIDCTISSATSQPGTLYDYITDTEYSFVRVVRNGTQFRFPDENMLIFGGASNRISPNASCYYLELYTADGLVTKMYPVRRLSDGAVGMYNIINKSFYPNAGTGTFGYGERVLPNDYDTLKYIESDGLSYIETGIEPDYQTGVKIQYSYPEVSQDVYAGILGTWTNQSPRSDALFISSFNGKTNSTLAMYQGGVLDETQTHNIVADEVYTAKIRFNNELSMGFEGYSDTTKTVTNNAVSSTPLRIFGRYSTPAQAYNYTKAKLYYATFTQETNVIHNYIPARKRSDGKIGLYDTVTKEFKENNGTGGFTSELIPIDYTRCEYIQSNGAAYIDTGIKANSDYYYMFKVARTSPITYNIWGTKEASGYNDGSCLIVGWTGTLDIGAYNHNGSATGSVPQLVHWGTNVHTIDFAPTKSIYKMDGTDYWSQFNAAGTTFTNESWKSNLNLYLGGTNTVGSFVGGGVSKWYEYKVIDDDKVIQHFIPCKRNLDNVYGMYDLVTGSFFPSNSSTAFTGN